MLRTCTIRTVFAFASTHHVLSAEKILTRMGIKATVIPTPRGLSSVCGLALVVDVDSRYRAEELLIKAGLKIQNIVDFA